MSFFQLQTMSKAQATTTAPLATRPRTRTTTFWTRTPRGNSARPAPLSPTTSSRPWRGPSRNRSTSASRTGRSWPPNSTCQTPRSRPGTRTAGPSGRGRPQWAWSSWPKPATTLPCKTSTGQARPPASCRQPLWPWPPEPDTATTRLPQGLPEDPRESEPSAP